MNVEGIVGLVFLSFLFPTTERSCSHFLLLQILGFQFHEEVLADEDVFVLIQLTIQYIVLSSFGSNHESNA